VPHRNTRATLLLAPASLTATEVTALADTHPTAVLTHPNLADAALGAVLPRLNARGLHTALGAWTPERPAALLGIALHRLVSLAGDDPEDAPKFPDVAVLRARLSPAELAAVVPHAFQTDTYASWTLLTAGLGTDAVLNAATPRTTAAWLLGPHTTDMPVQDLLDHLEESTPDDDDGPIVCALLQAQMPDPDARAALRTFAATLYGTRPSVDERVDIATARAAAMAEHLLQPCPGDCPELRLDPYADDALTTTLTLLTAVAHAPNAVHTDHADTIVAILTALGQPRPVELTLNLGYDHTNTLLALMLNCIAARAARQLHRPTTPDRRLPQPPWHERELWTTASGDAPIQTDPLPGGVLAGGVISTLLQDCDQAQRVALWRFILDVADGWDGTVAELVHTARSVHTAPAR
jgi:hypothetical protein